MSEAPRCSRAPDAPSAKISEAPRCPRAPGVRDSQIPRPHMSEAPCFPRRLRPSHVPSPKMSESSDFQGPGSQMFEAVRPPDVRGSEPICASSPDVQDPDISAAPGLKHPRFKPTLNTFHWETVYDNDKTRDSHVTQLKAASVRQYSTTQPPTETQT